MFSLTNDSSGALALTVGLGDGRICQDLLPLGQCQGSCIPSHACNSTPGQQLRVVGPCGVCRVQASFQVAKIHSSHLLYITRFIKKSTPDSLMADVHSCRWFRTAATYVANVRHALQAACCCFKQTQLWMPSTGRTSLRAACGQQVFQGKL